MQLPHNEPVLHYLSGSPERIALEHAIQNCYSTVLDIPMYIGGEKVFTSQKKEIRPPHRHQQVIGTFSEGNEQHVHQAIQVALEAKYKWMHTPLADRIQIFHTAATLLRSKYRATINAATMVGQSKNIVQAEIDAACELIDFFTFNNYYAELIESIQPFSPDGIKNSITYRPLEGFIVAITPFNFTAIAGNLPAAPALLGNTVIWKPAYTQVYSAHIILTVLEEAGLPPGVINLIYVDGPVLSSIAFRHPEFSGLHFTGSTTVFNQIQQTIQQNISLYKNYPRIVGETGGKDFVLVHASAALEAAATALFRGAFEYQGQKCSAASRAYIAKSCWPKIESLLLTWLSEVSVGPIEESQHFINAVIDAKAFDKITSYIEWARQDQETTIVYGGTYSAEVGYFISPTILLTTNPKSKTMVEEIFGPVLTIYLFEDTELDSVLTLINESTTYALTGSIFANDENSITYCKEKLWYAAGNLYINDKPTGAVVNQQPFGGARKSGTNDKAGSVLNLLRWVSPLTIKNTSNAPTSPWYPYMK